MSNEIYWLTLTVVLTALLVLPYAVARILEIGLGGLFTNPPPGDAPFEAKWAHRAHRAHMNGFENLIIFAPLALAVHVTGTGNEVTAAAAATYFWARVVHAPSYIFKIPFVRTLAYFVGLGACFVLAWQLIA
ncbi:MAG: MAPEG family protein [Rhodospirillales bacterium]|nr:MAPEG family protein [Rhodospirillales bacterium]